MTTTRSLSFSPRSFDSDSSRRPIALVIAGLLLATFVVSPLSAQSPAGADDGEWHELKGGLVYQDVEIGDGKEAGRSSWVTVTYTGWLEDGTEFDSNRNGAAMVVRLGQGQVIRGWERGIPGMKQGGVRRLRIPGKLAYGKSGVKGRDGLYRIPPNATLIFEIELVGVR